MREQLQRSPDPILSADLYRNGLLDHSLSRAVAPFYQEVRAILGHRSSPWFVRASNGREHIKLRLHGEAGDIADLKALMTAYIDRDFDTVIWTTYDRTPMWLAWPWLNHDAYSSRAYTCLSAGSALVLARLGASDIGRAALQREKLLIHLALKAFKPLQLDNPKGLCDYLGYHRDWLLRFFLRSASKEAGALQQFTDEAERRSATINQIRSLLDVSRSGCNSSIEEDWLTTLADLSVYIRSSCGLPEYDADEFAASPAFPPLFKILHSLANQIGVPLLREAFAYQLMLVAADSGASGGAL